MAAAPRPAALLWPHARGERGGAGLGKVSATGMGEGFLAQDCGFGSLGGAGDAAEALGSQERPA